MFERARVVQYVTELVGAMYAKWTAIRQARAEGGTHTSIRLSLVKLSRNGGQPNAEHDGEEAPAPDPGLDLYSPGDHHIRRAGRMFELIRRANRVEYGCVKPCSLHYWRWFCDECVSMCLFPNQHASDAT
jgi:hypothetical protein